MPTLPDEDNLEQKRYATLILSLVLDGQGNLLSGELLDATNGFQERFIQWRGLIHMLRVWLAHQTQRDTSDD